MNLGSPTLTALALSALSATPVCAALILPADLAPGDSYRLAFLTSSTRDSQSSNIADYNAFVTAEANLPGSVVADIVTDWRAIGSTEFVDARDNTGTNPNVAAGVPIYLVDGDRIANNNADLWDGDISAPLNVNQFGVEESSGFASTGSTVDGRSDELNHLGSRRLTRGGSISITISWSNSSTVFISNPTSFFALSGVLTIAVPEPASGFLVTTAACCWIGRRHRR